MCEKEKMDCMLQNHNMYCTVVFNVTGDSAGKGGRNAVSQSGSSFPQGRVEDCSNGTEVSSHVPD